MPTSSYQAITPILLIRKMIKMMVMVMLMLMVMVMDWRKQNLNETLQQICVGNTVVHVCECVWGPILILVGTDPCSGTHLPTKLYLPPYEGRMIPGHHVQHLASLSPELALRSHPTNRATHTVPNGSMLQPDHSLTSIWLSLDLLQSGQSLAQCGLAF